MKVRARVFLLPSELGGRGSAVISGYHAAFYLNEVATSAIMSFSNVPSLAPGHVSVVDLDVLHPELHASGLTPGLQFQLREGVKTVGIGVVLPAS